LGVDSNLDSQPGGLDEDASVRHLVELGYVDPTQIAAREAARRRELQAQLRDAIEMNRQGRGQEAAALLQKLAGDDPDWIAPHRLLAEICYSAGQFQAAEAHLEWLVHHGVDLPPVALMSARLALARRDLRTALAELEFARWVDPNLPAVNTLFGTVLRRLGRWTEAEDAFRLAVEQDPTDARARDGLAAICLMHGEYEDAADWALRALEQDMRLFNAHYHLGLALSFLQRPDDAITALETATRLESERVAPYFRLSRIAGEQLKDPTRSASYRDCAREIIRGRSKRRPTRIIST
jgi:tetratricopeptide (TPR) repeat protein